MADDDEHGVGYDHREEEPISSDRTKASSVDLCRCDGDGIRDGHRCEHNQREPDEGDGVEDIEQLERAELLCGCDEEAGDGRAETETEVARDAGKRDGGRALLGPH